MDKSSGKAEDLDGRSFNVNRVVYLIDLTVTFPIKILLRMMEMFVWILYEATVLEDKSHLKDLPGQMFTLSHIWIFQPWWLHHTSL